MKSITIGVFIALAFIAPITQALALARAPYTYTDSRQRYLLSLDRYKKARTAFLEAKRNKEQRNLESTKDDQKIYIEQTREFVRDAINVMIRQTALAMTKIEYSKGVSAEKKSELSELLKEKVEDLRSIEEVVDNTQSERGLKTAAQDVKNEWPGTRFIIRFSGEQFLASRVGFYLDYAKNTLEQAEKTEKNKEAIIELETFYEEARDALTKAEERLENAGSADDPYASLRDVHAKLRRAHFLIKKIYPFIQEIT